MNFNDRIKRLNITPARRLQYEEETLYGVKVLSNHPARIFGNIPYQIVLPEFYYLDTTAFQYSPRCITTFKVIMPEDFLILRSDIVIEFAEYLRNCFIAIRWKDGDEVKRYILIGSSDLVYCWQPLTNERIAAECFIEIWAKNLDNPVGILQPIKLRTSIITEPQNFSETEQLVDPSNTYELDDVSFQMPINIPFQMP